MKFRHKQPKNVDVGASKAAKVIIGRLDRRFIQPATILVRITGWALTILVAYISIFENLSKKEQQSIYLWIGLYVLYMVLLEIIKNRSSEFYEVPWFRWTRIAVNLIMISALVSIAPAERHLFIFAYAVPILATIVYFAEKKWAKILVYFLALLGIYAGELIIKNSPRLELSQFLIYATVLAVLTIGFETLRNRTNVTPGRVTEIAKELYKTLDLQKLMTDILVNAVEITVAQQGLILIINPRSKKYVGHCLHNFKLNTNKSIETLAKECFVLTHGQPFENPDMVTAFRNKSIYSEFFDKQPRSVMAEPLFNHLGQVIGVINVAHNDPNRFDKISKNLLREFAFLVSNAIENCFEHREVKLREAKSKEAGEKFVSAGSEDDAINILFEEVYQQIPHAEKLTLHQFTPKDGGLLPIHSFSLETTPNIYIWSSRKSNKLKPDLYLGHGIAGHALELREPILVPDVELHPWFVKLDHAPNIRSLLVAPLFDPKSNELYGTLSLESSSPDMFNLEDESTLTYLSTQASLAIAQVRNFKAWREQGSTLRQIMERIQAIDLSASEEEILQRITDTAINLLGFKIARIRILVGNHLVTKAVSGVSERTRKRIMDVDLPYSEVTPFLIDKFKVERSYFIKHGDPAWEKFVNQYFQLTQRNVQKTQGWHAYDALITPLLDSSGNSLGILTLDLPISGSEPNRQLLESIGVFASSTGWMIELSRFQKRLEDQHYRTQSFIDTLSQELAKGRDRNTICAVVVQVGAKLLSSEGCSLHLKSGNFIQLTHSNYLTTTDLISRRKPISTSPRAGLTAWVAATGETLCFNDEEYKKHPAWAMDNEHLQYLPGGSCQSVLLAPVKDKEGNVIGVITLENKKTVTGLKDFDERDKERLISLANEFAKALEVIGLYEDIKEWERIELADDLHDLINWYHSGVILWIEALEQWLKRDDDEKINELMPQLRAHAYTTVFELKALHTNMLNKSLEVDRLKLGLWETMSAWTKRVTPKYKESMRIHLDCPEDIEIPIALRNTMIRIASLAFSNTLLHSGILENPNIEVNVSVKKEGRRVILGVEDTGRGIDFSKTSEGYGFERMRHLSKKMNAWEGVKSDLQIDTGINMGTKVFLLLQIEGKNALST
jgi:GAF domain-containing protein